MERASSSSLDLYSMNEHFRKSSQYISLVLTIEENESEVSFILRVFFTVTHSKIQCKTLTKWYNVFGSFVYVRIVSIIKHSSVTLFELKTSLLLYIPLACLKKQIRLNFTKWYMLWWWSIHQNSTNQPANHTTPTKP